MLSKKEEGCYLKIGVATSNWKFDEANKKFVILVQLDSEQIEVEITGDSLKQMAMANVPTEEKRINELMDQIHDIIKKRLLTADKIAEDLAEFTKEANDIAKQFDQAKSKIDTMICNGKLKVVDVKRANIDKKRHLIKLLTLEEAALRLKLERLKRGMEE